MYLSLQPDLPPRVGGRSQASFGFKPLLAREIHGAPSHGSPRKVSTAGPTDYPPVSKSSSAHPADSRGGELPCLKKRNEGSTRLRGRWEHICFATFTGTHSVCLALYPRKRRGTHPRTELLIGGPIPVGHHASSLLSFSNLSSCGSQWSFLPVKIQSTTYPTPMECAFCSSSEGDTKEQAGHSSAH